MRKPKTISEYYNHARKLLSEGKRDEARDAIDFALVLAAQITQDHPSDDYLVDRVRMGLWKERLWYFLENNDLMLCSEEEIKTEAI